VSKPAPVLKALVKSASGFPDTSCTALVAAMVTSLAAGVVPPDMNTVRLSCEMLEMNPNRAVGEERQRVVVHGCRVERLGERDHDRRFRPTPVVPGPV
jgi:hypothetical protein